MLTYQTTRLKNRRGILRRLWNYLDTYRSGLIGMGALIFVTMGLGLCGPYLIGRAVDDYIAHGNLSGLARLMGLMIAVCVLRAGGTWLQSVGMVHIAQRTVKDIRDDLFGRLQTLPLRYFDSNPHGDTMSRVTNDTDNISNALANSVSQAFSSAISVLGAGVIMFAMSWQLALISMVTMPMIALATRIIAYRTRQGFRDRQQALGTLNGIVEEDIVAQRVVKICCHEEETIRDFELANTDLRQKAIKAGVYVGLMGPTMNMCRNIGFAVVAGAGGWMVSNGSITIGVVAAFINYADFFNRPLLHLANLYGMIQSGLAGAERVFDVMDEIPEEEDKTDAIDLQKVRGEIDFQNVCFGYARDVPVLADVSFHVEPGQTIALIGSTGAGKTTIINLLTRFYDVDRGSIRIDGRDIQSIRKSNLRKMLGIVLQDTFLFGDTVRENIRYGRLDATDDEVEVAARLANADSFIRHLPSGYDTKLHDAGGSLSQGQRQLLAIARALLADPAILILDEATSNVDTRTEAHVQQALHRLMQNRTSIIIAHRLNTVQRADLILVIENGKIVEQGSHSELLAMEGAYYRLHSGNNGEINNVDSVSCENKK